MKPGVLWLTGLSGAGKTTLAKGLILELQNKGIAPIYLDGDELRDILERGGFDVESRKLHNLQIGRLAALLEKQGHVVIVALISPFADVRREVKSFCKNFSEIHIDASIGTCIKRDPKGLYKKALANEISDFTGISSPYEAPTQADLVISSDRVSIAEGVQALLRFCERW